MSAPYQYPYQNTSLPLEERVNDLVSRFTPEEKVELMIQYQAAVERLGVKAYKHGTEAAHGMAWLGEATGFPQPIGLGCTWDTELMKQIGSAIGDEARGFYRRNPEINGLTLWAPTVDLERDPRWGRTEEAYGEDPILTGKLASALVQGIQGDHPVYLKAVATLKHFIANNNEVGRGDESVSIDPRNMREYYLKAFEIPFKEGGAQSMMTAYNAINGVPANLSPDVKAIVKEEWGMDGFVVSDAYDVTGTVRDHGYLDTYKEAVARSVKEGGIDSITDDGEAIKAALREALAEGMLTEGDLDTALRNTFRVRFRLGEFDPEEGNPYAAIDESVIMKPEHAELSREAVRKATVLLKNDGELLPLQAGKLEKVAVIGPLGGKVYRDWYSGEMPYTVTPLQGIQEKLDAAEAGGQTTFAGGIDRIRLKSKKTGRYVKVQAGEQAALAATAEEASDASVFEMTDWGWDSHTLIAEENGLYWTTDDKIVKASSERIWEWFTKEVFLITPEQDGSAAVTFSTWNGTPVTVNEATGELLVGDGQAAETANEINVAGAAEVSGEEGEAISADAFEIEYVTEKLQAAREAAASADLAVVFVGNHPLINGKETIDRPDITLPASQEQLIREVYASNRNTVVVVVGSYPFALGWVDEHVPSILYTSHAGQELGRALGDVLFGEYNPAGRLNMTWYKSVDQLPPFMDYDIIKHGRTYQYFEGDTLYPFGHGLSYTSFRYDTLATEQAFVTAAADTAAEIRVTCRITNTGAYAGEEVVQLYGRAEASRVKRPLKQLLAFRRVFLQPGESADVTFAVPLQELAIWDVTRDRFCIETGAYTILAGSSSERTPLSATVQVEGEVIPPRDLGQPTKAVNYDDYENVLIGEGEGGGSAVYVQTAAGGSEGNGPQGWIAFAGAELGTAATSLKLRAAGVQDGIVEVRTGGPQGPLAGRVEIAAADAGQWQEYTCGLSGLSGLQDVYLVLTGAVAVSTLALA